MTPNTAPKKLPYDPQHTPAGRFKAAGPEPINSPNITFRLTDRQYQTLKAIAGKKRAQWIRDAIDMRLAPLELQQSQRASAQVEASSPGSFPRRNACRSGVEGKKWPYDLQHTPGGRFKAAGCEPVNSPPIVLRLTNSQYQKLKAIAGKKKAQWIRDAIDMSLAAEEPQQSLPASAQVEASSPGSVPRRKASGSRVKGT